MIKIQASFQKIGDKIRQLEIDPQPFSSLMAVKDFLDNIAIHKAKRDFIQSNRRRDDKALFTYFKGQFLSVSGDETIRTADKHAFISWHL